MNTQQANPAFGIFFILVGMLGITLNDVFVKYLSGDYPLHQIVFVRSGLGIFFSLMIVQVEGGMKILKTDQPYLHAFRGMLLVVANMTYFAALASLSLAEATALFFVAPLFITLLSIPILGEKVGPMRLGAVVVGFVGVLIMQRPWQGSEMMEVSRLILLLPLFAAFTYALNQILTRKLGVKSKASAMAIYIQTAFIIVSLLFYVVAGDGRFAEGVDNPSMQFLFRAWTIPARDDLWVFAVLGVNSALIGYCIGQAYRLADAATVAPYEYVGLPLAVLLGFLVFGDLPAPAVWAGIALILGAGVFVFIREQQKKRA